MIIIDADLQDPPEVIPELVAAWRLGLRHGLARRPCTAGGDSPQEADRAHVLSADARRGGVKLPEDTGDFRLMSRRVVDAVASCANIIVS